MHLALSFFLALSLTLVLAAASVDDPQPTLTLAYQLLTSASSPTPFAHLSRIDKEPDRTASVPAAGTYVLSFYNPPSFGDPDALIRISVSSSSSDTTSLSSSTTLTSLSSILDPSSALVRIVQNAKHEVVAVSAHRLDDAVTRRERGGEAKGQTADVPRLEVVRAMAEPRAALNKPVLLNAEGKVEAEQAEKTLLQR